MAQAVKVGMKWPVWTLLHVRDARGFEIDAQQVRADPIVGPRPPPDRFHRRPVLKIVSQQIGNVQWQWLYLRPTTFVLLRRQGNGRRVFVQIERLRSQTGQG